MPAYAGNQAAVLLNTTGVTFVAVGGFRTKRLTVNATQVDVTTQDSVGRWRELLASAGVNALSFAGSGVFQDDAVINALLTSLYGGTMRTMQIVIPQLGTFQGLFMVQQLQLQADYNDAVTYDISLESGGAITFTPA